MSGLSRRSAGGEFFGVGHENKFGNGAGAAISHRLNKNLASPLTSAITILGNFLETKDLIGHLRHNPWLGKAQRHQILLSGIDHSGRPT